MGGFITKKEVLANPRVIIRAWGFRFWVACLLAKRGETFLGLLARRGGI